MGDNKYIVDEDGNYMIFSNTIHHKTAQCASSRHARVPCVGAGFIGIGPDGVACWGYSESLGIKSRGVEDAKVIAHRLNLKVNTPVPQ